jgi:hypothetical protein
MSFHLFARNVSLAAGIAVLSAPAIEAQNVVPNGTFGTDLAGWTINGLGSMSWDGAEGSVSGPGSARVVCSAIPSPRPGTWRCFDDVTLAGQSGVNYSADFREEGTTATDCSVRLVAYTGSGCGGTSTDLGPTPGADPGTGSYVRSASGSPITVPATTQALYVEATCACTSGALNVDDIFVGIGLVPVGLMTFTVE